MKTFGGRQLATLLLGGCLLNARAHAQSGPIPPVSTIGDTVTVTPGPDYHRSGLARTILGSNWRDLWLTPVDAPVFDLGHYAGGLDIIQLGGGFQTITLHLVERNGWREHRYRSVDKFPMQRMPDAIRGTLAGRILEDQVSTLFPAAPLLVSPLMQAIDALHVDADLYIMPDDPRLGEHRSLFGGVLGTVELKPDNAPDRNPGFAGSPRIKGTGGFFDDLEESREHRLDEAEFFAVRLIDILVNDSDRTPDNFEWAAFEADDGYDWRPVARDRDRAFMDAGGWLNRLLTRRFYPKLVEFSPEYPLEGLTFTSYQLDRRLLQRLSRADTERIAAAVQDRITDDVIEQVIARLPDRWHAQTDAAERLRSVLRARRDRIPDVARRFYEDLASDVDIRGTDEDERVVVFRHDDGRVTVRMTGREDPELPASVATLGTATEPEARTAFYERTFEPSETKEIRVYLRGGDDRAIVRGSNSEAITVRVIGGGGDDVLIDSAGGANHFYDEAGDNEFVISHDTRVSIAPWHAPPEAGGFRLGTAWSPDWGGISGWSPVIGYKDRHGVLIGFGPSRRVYGFRRLPHHWEAGAQLMVGTRSGRLGLRSQLDYRAENSPLAYTVELRATQLESFRFYGFGNNTPDAGDAAVVAEDQIAFEPALVWHIGWRSREGLSDPVRGHGMESQQLLPLIGLLQFGPVLHWSDPRIPAGSPLLNSGVDGASSYGRLGLRLGLELERTDRVPVPTRGWTVQAAMIGFPPLLDVREAFNTAHAEASGYLPLPVRGANLALRAGGVIASGAYPVQHAATVGGRTTLRGHPWQRYAGDHAAFGSTELRVPTGSLNMFVRWQTGVFALADAGRVWHDGASPGGWHTGFGGGLWLDALGLVVSAAYARGESDRIYLQSGLGF